MIPVGLPSSINEVFDRKGKLDLVEKIGVIPEGESCFKDNVELILFVQEYCKKNNKRLLLKLHPTSNIDNYRDILDASICEAVYGKEIRILDFAKKIDIAIIRNSTGLLEMIEQMVPAFVFYSDQQELDVFKYVDSIRFKSED